MSMNNYVSIEKYKLGFKITERDADTNKWGGKPIIAKTAEEALLKASELESEYGIHYIDKIDQTI